MGSNVIVKPIEASLQLSSCEETPHWTCSGSVCLVCRGDVFSYPFISAVVECVCLNERCPSLPTECSAVCSVVTG